MKTETRPDWGQMNRELLAEDLYRAFHDMPAKVAGKSPFFSAESKERWLRVADAAVETVQGV